MTSRRVLHLASIRWNSAIAEYALSAARALKERGHPTKLIGLDGAPLLQRAGSHDIDTASMPSFDITQILRAKSLISDFKPDVIITHGGPETVLAGLAKSGAMLLRVRGYAAETGFLSSMTHDMGQVGVDGIVSPSLAIEQVLRTISKIPVKTIPLGIDTHRYQMVSPSKPERPTLLIFGRLDPVKGHREFMKLFKRICERWQGPVKPLLRIVGEPANLSLRHLEEFASDEGLIWHEDVTVHCERIQDVPALLAAATVGVVPSLGSEIICRVAEEFLCCGTPVFVSGVGSLTEVLISARMGYSYRGKTETEAANDMAQRLNQYYQETPDQRRDRSTEAREAFSLLSMAQGLERFINERFASRV